MKLVHLTGEEGEVVVNPEHVVAIVPNWGGCRLHMSNGVIVTFQQQRAKEIGKLIFDNQ